MAGRPTKLNKSRSENILAAISKGATMETAARITGISTVTLDRWLLRGRQPDAPKIYRDFVRDFEKAVATWELSLIKSIETAASDGTWTAAAWLLERRFPDRWGKRERLDVRQTTVVSKLGELKREELLADEKIIEAIEVVSERLDDNESDNIRALGDGGEISDAESS